MAQYTIYTANGAVRCTGSCPDGMESMQAQAGEGVMLGTATANQYVDLSVPGSPVFVDKPARPSTDHTWNQTTKAWEANLENARMALLRRVKQQRDVRTHTSFTWDGSIFDANMVSQTRLLGLYTSAINSPGIFPISWRLTNNDWRSLSAEDAVNVWTALQIHVQGHFGAFAVHEAAIASLDTLEELQSYDIESGWPS